MRSNCARESESERSLNLLTLFDGGRRDTVGYLFDERDEGAMQSARYRTHLQRISVIEV